MGKGKQIGIVISIALALIFIPLIFGTSLYKIIGMPAGFFFGVMGGIIGYIIGKPEPSPPPEPPNGQIELWYQKTCRVCEGLGWGWKKLPRPETDLKQFKEDAEIILDRLSELSDDVSVPEEFYDKLDDLGEIIDCLEE